MAIKCGNCGGHFSSNEILFRQRPRYPWNLTPGGTRALAENQARNSTMPPCPECGRLTLLG